MQYLQYLPLRLVTILISLMYVRILHYAECVDSSKGIKVRIILIEEVFFSFNKLSENIAQIPIQIQEFVHIKTFYLMSQITFSLIGFYYVSFNTIENTSGKQYKSLCCT